MGCRPLIGFDGTHPSGYFKSILLNAVTPDGNNEILPLAYGIVDQESSERWGYFFRNLKTVIQIQGIQRDDWTFISDRGGELKEHYIQFFLELLGEYAANIYTQTVEIQFLWNSIS